MEDRQKRSPRLEKRGVSLVPFPLMSLERGETSCEVVFRVCDDCIRKDMNY